MRPHAPRRTPRWAPIPIVAAGLLAGCGGGGDEPAAPETPASIVLSGVAATGAPMSRAAVRVFDATGGAVCATTASTEGEYRCTLEGSPRAPFTIVAETDTQRHFSTAPAAESARVNVTPLTTLIVARLAPDGNPASLVEAVRADPSVVTPARVQARVDEVVALLAPLTGAVGDTVNPLSGTFSADGTGHDRVLDALQVSIRPEAEVSNIQITIKAQPARDSDPPIEIAFRSSDAAPPAPTFTLREADLPPQGIADKVEDYLRRAEACYALPLATRIANVPAGATQATGTAASVQAPACRTLFVGDDPANYLDNGLRIGSAGAFQGLFRESTTGVAYDAGNLEYRWANGDLLITLRATTAAGVATPQTLTLREEAGTLKAVGNQYLYEANVRPYALDREFPLQPQFSYLGVGHNTAVVNRIDPATGLPMFREVIVTTPGGQTLTLRPQVGRSLLGIVRTNGSNSGSSVQLVAAQYLTPRSDGQPAGKDSGFVFASEQMDDMRLRGTPDQGVWTFEFVHADESLPNVVQTYRTVSRAMSLGELRRVAFAQFTDAQKAQWLARDDVAAHRGYVFGAPSAESPSRFSVGAAGAPGWTLPDGAVRVSSVTVFGGSISGSFNDTAAIGGNDAVAVVACSTQSAGDRHCDDSTGALQYAEGSRIWTVELFGRTLRQHDMAKHVAWFRLPD